MSVLVLFDTVQRKSVMYCSTSGRAFGPLFDDRDAIDFLRWYDLRADAPGDIRSLNDNTLDIWVSEWQIELDPEPTDVDTYGAGVK